MTMNFSQPQIKANFIFIALITIGGFFLAGMVYLARFLWPNLQLLSVTVWSRLEDVCGCGNHFVWTNHPYIFTGMMFLAVAILLIAVIFLYRLLSLSLATRKFVQYNLINHKINLSFKLERVASQIGLLGRVTEVNATGPTVFCYGLLRPKTCISSSLVARLSEKELMSVLLHEKHHLDYYEPMKLMIIRVIVRSLFFLPGLKLLFKQYSTLTEIAADQKAIGHFNDRNPISQALYKVIKWEEDRLRGSELSLSFFGTITDERINVLTDSSYRLRLKLFTPKTLVGWLAIILLPLILTIWFNAQNQFVNAGTCLLSDTVAVAQECQMTGYDANCQIQSPQLGRWCPDI